MLEIPTFHISVHNETHNFLSELNSEKIKNSFEQLSELISVIDNADFIKLGRNFAYWYARKNGILNLTIINVVLLSFLMW